MKLDGTAPVAAVAAVGVVEPFDIQRHAVETLVDIAPEGLDHAPDKVLDPDNLEAALDSALGSDVLGTCFDH